MTVIQDTMDDRYPPTIVDWLRAGDETVKRWSLMGHEEALTELVRRNAHSYRFNPHHDKVGKFSTGHGGLSPAQYEGLKPTGANQFDRNNLTYADLDLQETQEGRDVSELGQDFQESTTGAQSVRDDTWHVLNGRSKGKERDRQIHSLVDAAREVPQDMIPPKLYRGVAIDHGDLGTFLNENAKGKTIEIGPSSFSSQKSTGVAYATDPDSFLDRPTPILIEVDTSGGMQALPIENLAKTAQQYDQHEFIGMGRFEVVDYIPKGKWDGASKPNRLLLKQVGVY